MVQGEGSFSIHSFLHSGNGLLDIPKVIELKMSDLLLLTGQCSAFLLCSMILTPKMPELLVLKGWSIEKVQLCQDSQASIWAQTSALKI